MRISEKTSEDIVKEQIQQEIQEAREYARLEELANLTNEEIDTYIEDHLTNITSAKIAFKKLVKWNRALTKALLRS